MFIWNESKRLKVIKNHKVDFALLTDIFDDPFGIYREDFEHSDDEIRYSVVGMTVQYGMLFVVLTYSKEKVRLITARKAEKWMVKDYEQRI